MTQKPVNIISDNIISNVVYVHQFESQYYVT